MNTTKFRVRKISTGNFVSDELSPHKATELCGKLTDFNNGVTDYEVVESVNEKLKELEEAPADPRPMDDIELKAARKLYPSVTFHLGAGSHKNFAEDLYNKVLTGETTITEKQAVYLWHLVFRYRKQIDDQQLINIAQERKIY